MMVYGSSLVVQNGCLLEFITFLYWLKHKFMMVEKPLVCLKPTAADNGKLGTVNEALNNMNDSYSSSLDN